MSPFPSIMRRFSRSSSVRSKNQQQTPQSPTSYTGPGGAIGSAGAGAISSSPTSATAAGNSAREQALGGGYMVLPPGGGTVANDGRPISSATDGSFDFANRPVSGVPSVGGGASGRVAMSSQMPQGSVPGDGLSRTDQVVLKYFWESKYAENAKRDLHYLKFPFFPQFPGHKDLLPYCEIYHLVKTSPGANIISLGSTNGVYIGFELQTGSQLHIDLDDDWFANGSASNITHHRVIFRPFNSIISDPDSSIAFKSWPKPLTIEFLEDQYQAWTQDLTSLCWESSEVRELGAATATTSSAGGASEPRGPATQQPQRTSQPQQQAAGPGVRTTAASQSSTAGAGSARNIPGPMVDDDYGSERSDGRGI